MTWWDSHGIEDRAICTTWAVYERIIESLNQRWLKSQNYFVIKEDEGVVNKNPVLRDNGSYSNVLICVTFVRSWMTWNLFVKDTEPSSGFSYRVHKIRCETYIFASTQARVWPQQNLQACLPLHMAPGSWYFNETRWPATTINRFGTVTADRICNVRIQ